MPVEYTPPVANETPEQTALRLMERMLSETWQEGVKRTQDEVLAAYAKALDAVKGKRG